MFPLRALACPVKYHFLVSRRRINRGVFAREFYYPWTYPSNFRETYNLIDVPKVYDFDVHELIDEDSVKLIKIKAILRENWLLYITELHTKDYQKYSYHCQKNDGDLIVRWDNKPHWRGMSTYPHHKHENDKVSPSHRVTIVDVLDQIEEKIAVKKGLS